MLPGAVKLDSHQVWVLKLIAEHSFQFAIVDDLERVTFTIFEIRWWPSRHGGGLRVKLALARVRVGAGVEGFTPDVASDNSVDDVDAVIEMDQVDIGFRVFDGFTASEEPTRVAAGAD